MKNATFPRALHLCSFDITGGAAIAAYRLHSGLRDAGVHSSMLVRYKASTDDSVHQVETSYSFVAKWRRESRAKRISADFARYKDTISPTLEALSDDRAAAAADVIRSMPATDIYHLHWVAGLVDYHEFFKFLPRGAPLVWTLHDINPFSGGCHYGLGCERYKDHCGACPQLGSTDPSDLTAKIFERKARALERLLPQTTVIVAPSNWMAREAKASRLFRDLEIVRIANGIDTHLFQPRDRAAARQRLGLPHDAKIVTFAAHVLTNHRKGFDLLAAAIERLPEEQNIVVASIGAFGEDLRTNRRHIRVGEITTEEQMSYALSAADLFVCPSRADNLPNVALEALACGVPAIGFDVGGVSDVIRPNITGTLAPAEDVSALSTAIASILHDDETRRFLSRNCRNIAVDEFCLRKQARQYLDLYEKLYAASLVRRI